MKDIDTIALEVANAYFDKQESEAMDAPWLRAFVVANARHLVERLAKPEPVATLHDDGYWTLSKNASDIGYLSQRAGWRMKLYAAPVIPAGWKLVSVEPTEDEK